MKAYYDLHIHTALSPCGDDDMTPNNIVNMAKLCGLDIIGITDHNSCGNCEVIESLGKELGITVLSGMELETSEEVHVVLLFPSAEMAKKCEQFVKANRFLIKNRPDIYGNQRLFNAEDEVVGEEEYLLVTATNIGIYDAVALAERFGGIAFPAHIDRPSHGLIQMLGAIDEAMNFSVVEMSETASKSMEEEYEKMGYKVLRNSDSHYIHTLNEQQSNFLELESLSAQEVIKALKR